MDRNRMMAQTTPSTDSQLFFKFHADRERKMRMEYMDKLMPGIISPPDEEAPLDLPQTTCIVFEPLRNIFAWFL